MIEFSEFNRQYAKYAQDAAKNLLDKIKGQGVYWLMQPIRKRVQTKGIAFDETKFSNYSTKPAYISPDISPKKFKGQGKTGKDVFASGKAHKTKYFPSGYKQFRGFIGRPNAYKNFTLSGLMFKDIGVKKESLVGKSRIEILIKADKYQEQLNNVSKQEGKNIILNTEKETKVFLDFCNEKLLEDLKK